VSAVDELGLRLASPALAAVVAERVALERAAQAIAARIAGGGRLLTFGAGHSQSLAAELCSRAGGLRGVTSMSLEDLRDEPRAAYEQLADSEPERVPANGVALLERYGVTAADALLVVSQSGRNGASVEMARVARELGVHTTGVLSRAHCAAFPSRHPDGLKLVDVVDVVVDNHCPVGDAVIETDDGAVSATSTIAGALLLQVLNVRVVAGIRALGAVPPVIRSANVDESA
jgi:uncharacterized phosphosugar-binding protein